jgi:hypothetical protein
MSVGYPVDKNALDARAGGIAQIIRDNFDAALRLNAWLLATPDLTLTSTPYNYSAGEVAILKSAYADLAAVINLSRGTGTQASTKNSWAFTNQLLGLA